MGEKTELKVMKGFTLTQLKSNSERIALWSQQRHCLAQALSNTDIKIILETRER